MTYSAAMLRRLASGAALVAIVTVALAGCTPAASESTDAEVLDEVRETFDGFYQVVDQQFAAGQASPSAFERYATSELGARWANDIQSALDAGTSSRGVLRLVNIELEERTTDRVRVALCTDGSDIEATDQDGVPITPSGLVPWDAAFERSPETSDLLLHEFEPSEDGAVCDT